MMKDIIPRIKLERAKAAGDWAAVIEQLDAMIAANPKDLRSMMEKFNLLMKRMDRPDKAYAIANKIADANWDNPRLMNMLAWTIVDDPEIVKRDLKLAKKLATRANDLTKSKDPAVIDTLARVFFETGNYREAVSWQRKAVELAGDNPMGDDLKKALDRYEKAMGN